MEYVCGSSLSDSEYTEDERNKDLAVLKLVFINENLSCSSNIYLVIHASI